MKRHLSSSSARLFSRHHSGAFGFSIVLGMFAKATEPLLASTTGIMAPEEESTMMRDIGMDWRVRERERLELNKE